jgi:hypothetical protein
MKLLNNVKFIYDRKIQLVICTWATIEILQNTKYAINFFVMHLSSFFGAIVLIYFIDYFKKNKWLKTTPIIIEIFHSLYFQNKFDYWDVVFSIIGISFYQIFILKSKFNVNIR